jgi:hypothetical protein
VSDGVDASQRIVEATETALLRENWTPRRTVVIAEVSDDSGGRLLLGAASAGLSTWDIIGMLGQELHVVFRDIEV